MNALGDLLRDTTIAGVLARAASVLLVFAVCWAIVRFDLGRWLDRFLVLALLLGGCGRIAYEPKDVDAGESSSELLGTWQRSADNCELALSFDDAGVVTLERACGDSCTFQLEGTYELAGDVVRFDLEIDGYAVMPDTATWHVDGDELELSPGGLVYQRAGDAGELARLCP